jgi:hypothetical protein
MRHDWTMTRLETALFLMGLTIMTGGFMWVVGIG